MATTTYSALRYPLSTAAPNVNQDIQNLASDLDQTVRRLVANPTARNGLSAKYDGMEVFEQSTRRKYMWNATTSGWDYAGGAPPPIVAATIQGGWGTLSGHGVGVYKDSSGLVHLVGAVTNTTTYNPNATPANVCQLPAGYFNPNVLITGQMTLGSGVGTPVSFQISTSGMLSVNGSTSSSIASGSGHWLEAAAPFHTTYAGTVPLA